MGKRSPGARTQAVYRGSHRGTGAIGCERVQRRSETKRRLASGTAKYVFNPLVRALFRLGLPVPGTAILETTGRKSGRPRRNPVTNGLDDGVFRIVAEHGRRANYVRKRPMPDDDPRERLRDIEGEDLAEYEGERPLFLETSRPGIFAVGDVHSGSIKRVASAVGEGSMAVCLIHQRLAGLR